MDRLSAPLKLELARHRDDDDKNIRRARQRAALGTTVSYIEEHLPMVQSMSRAEQVLTFALSQVAIPEGMYLEFGVFQGRTINQIAAEFGGEIFGFDSFEGLPEAWRDGQPKGRFAVERMPQVRSNVRLIKGWFNESLPPFLAAHPGPVAFLHVDCDLYSSTACIFEHLGDRIVPGTIIIFDEYFNYADWEKGEFRAFREFLSRSKLSYDYLCYNHRGEQVVVRIVAAPAG